MHFFRMLTKLISLLRARKEDAIGQAAVSTTLPVVVLHPTSSSQRFIAELHAIKAMKLEGSPYTVRIAVGEDFIATNPLEAIKEHEEYLFRQINEAQKCASCCQAEVFMLLKSVQDFLINGISKKSRKVLDVATLRDVEQLLAHVNSKEDVSDFLKADGLTLLDELLITLAKYKGKSSSFESMGSICTNLFQIAQRYLNNQCLAEDREQDLQEFISYYKNNFVGFL